MAWPVFLLVALAQDVSVDLPPLLKARALLDSIERRGLTGNAAFEVALSAHTAAMQADLEVETKDFPNALRFLGPPELSVAKAWLAHERYRDPTTTARLPFPARLKSTVARCEHETVDGSEQYLKVAIQAGPDEFAVALLSLRSPVEIGSALAMLPQWSDPRAVPIGMELIRRLRRAVSSRREYDAAKDLKSQVRQFSSFAPPEFGEEIDAVMHYYESRSTALPDCGPGGKEPNSDQDNAFFELKRKVLRMDNSAALEFEYLENLIELFHLAEHDSNRRNELESAGNERMRVILRQLTKKANR